MSQTEPAGLFSSEGRVPLCGVRIDVRATGVASSITVAQRYQNTEPKPVEAVYSFPLEESSAVCGFEVEIEDKRIVGRVEESEKAFEQYDAAMAQGHGAFLVDQDRPNIFTASVGNLLPNQEAVIRLTYVSELDQVGDRVRLMIPTTISPRYLSAEELQTTDPAELDHIAPPTVLGGVPYGLELSVEMEAADEIKEVACPSHPARVSIEGRTIRVTLMGDDIQLDRDFVLDVILAHPHRASALVARGGDGERTVMINWFPDLSGFTRSPNEVIFLVDRSGSMQGESISQARRALQLCLRSLQQGDRFNIVGFGSTYESLFDESMSYSQQTLEKATEYVEKMQADLGGTELYRPLDFVLRASVSKELARQMILITDGQVSAEAKCIDLAAEHANSCRIFTFGVGYGASEYLVRGLARASRGQAEFIQPNERIEPKVLRQFARMASANLRNVRIDWGSLEVDLVAPYELSPLFDGDRVTVFARLTGGGPGEVAILADGPEGPMRFSVQVDTEKPVVDTKVAVLMARNAIRDLEEGRSSLVKGGGSAQTKRREKKAKSAIVELGCRYQLMSSQTSFVAIEERPDATQTQRAELRRIPIALTKGWHGLDQPMALSGLTASLAAPPPRMAALRGVPRAQAGRLAIDAMAASATSKAGGVFKGLAKALGTGFVGRKKAAGRMSAWAGAEPPGEAEREESFPCCATPSPAISGGKDDLMVITLNQLADGSFELTEDLARIAGVTRGELEEAALQLSISDPLSHRVVATLMALYLLEERFAERRVEWRLLAEKASRWLVNRVAPPAGFDSLEAWIRHVLKSAD